MLERPLNLRDIPGEMPPQKLYDMNLQKNLHAYGYASLTYKKIWQNSNVVCIPNFHGLWIP